MAGPSTFNSPYRTICQAYKNNGKVQEGEDPNSEKIADGMNRLNDIINFEQTQGLKLWLQYDLPVPLVIGQAAYTLGPGGSINMAKPLRVLDSCYYLDIHNNKRPLIPLARDDYARLSNVTQLGPINSYFCDKQEKQLSVSFWLTPDSITATGTAHLLVQQQAPNVVELTDDVGFPVEWYLFLQWALADETATGQPQAVIERCMAKTTFYRTALEDWDVEDASTIFQPDQRVQNDYSSFR